jgi:hypothetical protein
MDRTTYPLALAAAVTELAHVQLHVMVSFTWLYKTALAFVAIAMDLIRLGTADAEITSVVWRVLVKSRCYHHDFAVLKVLTIGETPFIA